MVTETGLKLRTKLESAKTLSAQTDGSTTRSAGDMAVVGNTIGVVVEDAEVSSEFVLVYEAEKIVVPKAATVVFAPGEKCYFDAAAGKVTSISTGNNLCGVALEDAAADDTEALIDLMVLA